ncbi:hypothetical protein [Halobaculum roseum]|uniref:Uncharacterized protein n=1 Tax=Halobaculum roseum TaxID=2175149 RepID=A0ABD5MI87_9EURY|nr:hypothetical protein [Halobaculum roseum]QZY02288.1 hypothetical protein K6T36_13430 [Halobaculum roseum]
MNLKTVAVVGAVVAVVAVGGAAAFIAGIGPLGDIGGGQSDTVTETPESTGTVYDDSSGSSGDDGGEGTASDGSGGDSLPPYTFAVTSIEECGQTCRDVTVRLDNNRDETATGISVYTRIFAGNSTASGDKVWEEKRDVGSLEAGGSTTETSRVKLSYSEGYQVQQEDGWITILTTVESDDVTITFKERRDVL